jgi:tRNA (guanine-N7-)-methyltransferase
MQSNRELIVEPVGLDPATLPKPIVWAELFGNDRPVELEVGMGKGTFLTEQAKARPDVNFFGIEWANWFWKYASDRLRRAGCTNARTVRTEASFFLTEHVPPASLDVLHIYFPDPWPKAKQQKRRLIQPKFVPVMARAVRPGGRVQVVTDHKGYWEENVEPTIRAAEGFKVVEYDRPESAAEGEVVGTNFERKYRREGRPFYAIAAVREG